MFLHVCFHGVMFFSLFFHVFFIRFRTGLAVPSSGLTHPNVFRHSRSQPVITNNFLDFQMVFVRENQKYQQNYTITRGSTTNLMILEQNY